MQYTHMFFATDICSFFRAASVLLVAMFVVGSVRAGADAPAPSAAPVLSPQQFAEDTALVVIPGRSFRMMKYDVTFELWDTCVAEAGCGGYIPDDENQGRGKMPVMNVSADDAEGFAAWMSQRSGKKFRLPTSEEWEYAARGGANSPYWWGDKPDCSKANFARISGNLCAAVADRKLGLLDVDTLPANGYGLYQVSGNVWQWTSSCVDASCRERILRGGAWLDTPASLRVDVAGHSLAVTHLPFYGFRLVVDQP